MTVASRNVLVFEQHAVSSSGSTHTQRPNQAPLGDSDRLEVGEWVMAIGNPFGLDSTVTSGIVSAKDRQIGAGPYDHFIQTDASINPGNSGGPLINLRGEVVGIDTAIFSQSGGNIGIGFAIPINLAKDVLPQLKSTGKVTRGWLGVSIQGVTPDLATSLGLETAKGGLVSSTAKNGPAEQAGIKAGDIVLEYDGKEINRASDLPFLVAITPVGKTVPIKVFRDKKETALTVTIGKLQEEEVVASTTEKGELGLTVQQINPEIAERLGLSRSRGVVITSVEPGGKGDGAGLEPGDIIREINYTGSPTASVRAACIKIETFCPAILPSGHTSRFERLITGHIEQACLSSWLV